MKNRQKVHIGGLLAFILILLLWTTGSLAAEITLAWDPNSNDNGDLIGYNLYYKAGSSILANPDGAVMTYIPLTETGFDPDQPSYQLTGLADGARYYFTVTAMYGDDESGMSNEVSSVNDSNGSSLNSVPRNDTGGASGGGCFIITLN